MRWNNLGIAYLDQLQFADAIAAFSEVVKLRPEYADGYTNVALTNMAWEKYGSARSSLARALALSRDNARALYYMALVERRAGNAEAEIADLKKVVSQYPESRDGRRDLGISYYRQHKYAEAVEQFEALQAIDSDDLTAHYNLSILYHRMGMEEKAAEQAQMYAIKKLDPAAATNSLDFLRVHTELSTELESVPWHVHSELPETTGARQGTSK
jgi:tetratricopeptide (TPR) repeat protein